MLHHLKHAPNFAGWIACVLYSTIPSFWLLIHPWAEHWRARRRSPYRVLLPCWIALWVLVGALTWPWHRLAFYHNALAWIPAAALFLTGISLYKHASKNFTSAQLGGLPEIQGGRHDQRLVTTGIRSRIRHPVYLGHVCEMLAWSLGTGLVVCYALTAFAVLTGAVMIRIEDEELEKRFGVAYRDYRASVPAIIPSRTVYNPDKLQAGGS